MPSATEEAGLPYIAALVNNDLVSLSYPLSVNATVCYLTMADPHGWRVYRRSLSFMLAKAVHELYPSARFCVEHSFGLGLYCNFCRGPDAEEGIDPDALARIESAMRDLGRRDLPIERQKVAYMDAIEQFKASGQTQKLALLRHRNPPRVVLHNCDGFTDLAHGPLVPSTGVIERFQLIHYPPGFVLHLPSREDPLHVPPFEDQPHLFSIYQEHKEWGRILGVDTVGRLNEIIASEELSTFINTAESLHEKKLGHIADSIANARDRVRVILVAGPSSAGKTTFSKRLSIHLTVNGIRPVTLGMDDYFVGAGKNPVDENGKPDYEHLEAVDLDLLNSQLSDLIDGKEVELPHYDFAQKRREFLGTRLSLEDGQMLIIEGIHGLNPRLTESVPNDRKFKVYISALTQLSLDANNRISTTDNRLMRRIIRDHKFRGYSALETLQQWPSVRRGEKRWIFPFQREADVTFNSALDYELAVLKTLVEPLLAEIKPCNPEYAEARRLSEFLLNFLPASDNSVPAISILREYIGKSQFHY